MWLHSHPVQPTLSLALLSASHGRRRRDTVELDWQVPRAAQERIRAVRRWIADQPEILQPPDEFGQGNLCFSPG